MRKLFTKYLIEEDTASLEAVGHLPHIGELIYTGQPDATIKHLDAVHRRLRGSPIPGHNLSYKADGKVSIVFGKRNGIPYVKYKGSASPEFYSEEQIHNHIHQTGKSHLLSPFLYGFRAAQHKNIDPNHSYQGDVLIPDDASDSLMGNIIKYRKPRSTASHAIAVHTHMDTRTGKRLSSNPDVSFLESTGGHFPNLNLNSHKFNITKKTSDEINGHLSSAQAILSDPSVADIALEIAQHRNPTNKTGHRHLHFVKFSNAVQRGTHARSVESMIDWTNERAMVTKGKEQERLQDHAAFISRNRGVLRQLFDAHNHIDHARSMMVGAIHEHGDALPLTPEGGHEEGEGFVSELPGTGQVKLVPTSFTIRNNQNKERFQKTGAQ